MATRTRKVTAPENAAEGTPSLEPKTQSQLRSDKSALEKRFNALALEFPPEISHLADAVGEAFSTIDKGLKQLKKLVVGSEQYVETSQLLQASLDRLRTLKNTLESLTTSSTVLDATSIDTIKKIAAEAGITVEIPRIAPDAEPEPSASGSDTAAGEAAPESAIAAPEAALTFDEQTYQNVLLNIYKSGVLNPGVIASDLGLSDPSAVGRALEALYKDGIISGKGRHRKFNKELAIVKLQSLGLLAEAPSNLSPESVPAPSVEISAASASEPASAPTRERAPRSERREKNPFAFGDTVFTENRDASFRRLIALGSVDLIDGKDVIVTDGNSLRPFSSRRLSKEKPADDAVVHTEITERNPIIVNDKEIQRGQILLHTAADKSISFVALDRVIRSEVPQAVGRKVESRGGVWHYVEPVEEVVLRGNDFNHVAITDTMPDIDARVAEQIQTLSRDSSVDVFESLPFSLGDTIYLKSRDFSESTEDSSSDLPAEREKICAKVRLVDIIAMPRGNTKKLMAVVTDGIDTLVRPIEFFEKELPAGASVTEQLIENRPPLHAGDLTLKVGQNLASSGHNGGKTPLRVLRVNLKERFVVVQQLKQDLSGFVSRSREEKIFASQFKRLKLRLWGKEENTFVESEEVEEFVPAASDMDSGDTSLDAVPGPELLATSSDSNTADVPPLASSTPEQIEATRVAAEVAAALAAEEIASQQAAAEAETKKAHVQKLENEAPKYQTLEYAFEVLGRERLSAIHERFARASFEQFELGERLMRDVEAEMQNLFSHLNPEQKAALTERVMARGFTSFAAFEEQWRSEGWLVLHNVIDQMVARDLQGMIECDEELRELMSEKEEGHGAHGDHGGHGGHGGHGASKKKGKIQKWIEKTWSNSKVGILTGAATSTAILALNKWAQTSISARATAATVGIFSTIAQRISDRSKFEQKMEKRDHIKEQVYARIKDGFLTKERHVGEERMLSVLEAILEHNVEGGTEGLVHAKSLDTRIQHEQAQYLKMFDHVKNMSKEDMAVLLPQAEKMEEYLTEMRLERALLIHDENNPSTAYSKAVRLQSNKSSFFRNAWDRVTRGAEGVSGEKRSLYSANKADFWKGTAAAALWNGAVGFTLASFLPRTGFNMGTEFIDSTARRAATRFGIIAGMKGMEAAQNEGRVIEAGQRKLLTKARLLLEKGDENSRRQAEELIFEAQRIASLGDKAIAGIKTGVIAGGIGAGVGMGIDGLRHALFPDDFYPANANKETSANANGTDPGPQNPSLIAAGGGSASGNLGYIDQGPPQLPPIETSNVANPSFTVGRGDGLLNAANHFQGDSEVGPRILGSIRENHSDWLRSSLAKGNAMRLSGDRLENFVNKDILHRWRVEEVEKFGVRIPKGNGDWLYTKTLQPGAKIEVVFDNKGPHLQVVDERFVSHHAPRAYAHHETKAPEKPFNSDEDLDRIRQRIASLGSGNLHMDDFNLNTTPETIEKDLILFKKPEVTGLFMDNKGHNVVEKWNLPNRELQDGDVAWRKVDTGANVGNRFRTEYMRLHVDPDTGVGSWEPMTRAEYASQTFAASAGAHAGEVSYSDRAAAMQDYHLSESDLNSIEKTGSLQKSGQYFVRNEAGHVEPLSKTGGAAPIEKPPVKATLEDPFQEDPAKSQVEIYDQPKHFKTFEDSTEYLQTSEAEHRFGDAPEQVQMLRNYGYILEHRDALYKDNGLERFIQEHFKLNMNDPKVQEKLGPMLSEMRQQQAIASKTFQEGMASKHTTAWKIQRELRPHIVGISKDDIQAINSGEWTNTRDLPADLEHFEERSIKRFLDKVIEDVRMEDAFDKIDRMSAAS